MDEESLTGGNASGSVTRVGGTVRKPWTDATSGIVDFLTALRRQGIDAPEPLGRDVQGRQIIEFVPGRLALDAVQLSPAELHRVGAMIRDIHNASASYRPPADAAWQTAIATPGADLICHNDLAPWNLIVGDRWVFIDWDAAAPSTRLWDLAYAAQAFTLNDPAQDPGHSARDLAALVAGYGADPAIRAALPRTMHERASAMLDLLRTAQVDGHEPWASLYRHGHGAHWAAVVRYVGDHQPVWARALS